MVTGLFRGFAGPLFAVLISLPACAPPMPQESRSPGLSVETRVWDFGTLERGETKTESISLANRSRDTLQVTLHSTCDCLTATPSEITLPPGARATVRLDYMGDEIKAPVTKTVFIDPHDAGQPRIAFKVTGNVIPGTCPHLFAVPDPLLLDPADSSYPAARLTITNRGTEPLRIEEITCFGCINAWSQGEVAQGEATVLDITPLDDWAGRRWIEILSNDPVQPLKRITIVEFE
jgi:hypothetical protein